MICPTCKNVNLLMSVRSNIEIDYCPDCRGVWLDRGELDKLIEFSSNNNLPNPNINPNMQNRSQNSFDNYNQRNTNVNNNPSNGYNNNPSNGNGDNRNYSNDNYNKNHDDYNNNHHKKHKKEGWFEDIFDF